MPYSKITVNCCSGGFLCAEQAELIKQNTSLPSPQLSPVLKSNLLVMAMSLKGVHRISNCPAGAPWFRLVSNQGVRMIESTSVRAFTESRFITWVASQLFSHVFI